MKEFWNRFVDFLSEYTIAKIATVLSQTDFKALLKNPLAWIATLAVLGLIFWKKQFRLLVPVVSLGCFVYLVQDVLPSGGETIPLDKLLEFVGGSIGIIAANVYVFFLRE